MTPRQPIHSGWLAPVGFDTELLLLIETAVQGIWPERQVCPTMRRSASGSSRPKPVVPILANERLVPTKTAGRANQERAL